MKQPSERPMAAARPHLAARISNLLNRLTGAVLRRLGWHPSVIAYPGYGQAGPGGWVRVLGRVLWAPPSRRPPARAVEDDLRGWRRFLTAPIPELDVAVQLPGEPDQRIARSGRGGYVDAVLPTELAAGRHAVELFPAVGADRGSEARAELLVAGRDDQLGVLSDIDDTVLVTHLPRPLLALWNTFVLRESARRAVAGMDELQRAALPGPDGLVVYLSTGPWNVVPALQAFLRRHRLIAGPMLMTDWGPTNTGWFRSGRDHKAAALRRLAAELPQVRWLLIGDDGQHDPQLYADFAREHPDRVAAVAIRRLTGVEQVLGGHPERAGHRRPGDGSPAGLSTAAVVQVSARNGRGLLAALRRAGALPPAAADPSAGPRSAHIE